MGHKKRNLAPRSKPSHPTSPPSTDSSAPAAAAAINSENSSNNASKPLTSDLEGITSGGEIIATANPCSPDDDDSSVKIECEKALNSLRRGNHHKALKLMTELCLKHGNSSHSALVHRVQATVCVQVASTLNDPDAKQSNLKNAIESARTAVTLSPNSVEFSHFYAKLLCDAANDDKDYQAVVKECNRALLIKNPVDPAKESLQQENRQKITTYEARVARVQNELRSLINLATISSCLKTLNAGEEKFQLIPVRRGPEDPVEYQVVQLSCPCDEIKKATKTPEERRREIEERVAVARILQHKSECPHLCNGVDSSNNKGLDSGSGSGQRAGDRRKSSKPPETTAAGAGTASGAYVPPTRRPGANNERPSTDMRRRNDENSVRVTNLSEDTREPDLVELFRPFGAVSRTYVAIDQKTGLSRGFGFVNFVSREDGERAINKLNGYGYDNLILRVEWAAPRAN